MHHWWRHFGNTKTRHFPGNHERKYL